LYSFVVQFLASPFVLAYPEELAVRREIIEFCVSETGYHAQSLQSLLQVRFQNNKNNLTYFFSN
jgi:hypothetical protein